LRDLFGRAERTGSDAATIDDRWVRSSLRYEVFDNEHFDSLSLFDQFLSGQELIQRRDGILGATLEGGGFLRQIGRTVPSGEFDRGRQRRTTRRARSWLAASEPGATACAIVAT
jgi:hypothetical protein